MYIHLRKGHLRSDANSYRKAWLNYAVLRLMPDNDIRIPRQLPQLDAHVSPLDNSRDRPPSCSARAHNMAGKGGGGEGTDVSLKTEDAVITTCLCPVVRRHNRTYTFAAFVCLITIDVKVSNE